MRLLAQQHEETKKSINNMLNAIHQGVITSSTKQRLSEPVEVKSNLEVSILQEQMQKPLLTREQLTFWICRFRKLDVTKQEQRQRLIDNFINSVYVFDDLAIVILTIGMGRRLFHRKRFKESSWVRDA